MIVFMGRVIRRIQREGGYTVIEVSVIIIVIAILATIFVDTALGYQVRARDSERTSDIDVISRGLERYYRTQAVATGPTYPPSSTSAASFSSIVESPDVLIAPGQTATSIVVATDNYSENPTVNQYIYQPLQVNGALCSSAPCPRYKLYYRTESPDQVVVKDSLRQQ